LPVPGHRQDACATEEAYRRRINVDWDRVAFGTHCVDCYPNNCPLYVFVKDGKVVREELAGVLEPVAPGVPDMNPMGCQKGLAWSRELYAPDRVLYPMRRAGERGEGRWERISWDEALAEVADAMIDAVEEVGPQAIVHEISPEISVLPPSSRFMNLIGGTALDVNATINDFWPGFHLTLGKFYFASSVDDLFNADCIVIWHANPAYTAIPAFHYLVEARYRGAQIVLVSPDVSPSHSHADFHIPVGHGTDAALALAMCQTIIAEGLADLSFVRSQTDLSLLVRTDTSVTDTSVTDTSVTDTSEFLRQSHLEAGGRDDRFYHWHPAKGVVPADPASLLLDFDPVLDGTIEVQLADGGCVTVEPLFARLRRLLDSRYTPEAAAAICGSHPETIRTIARLVATRRTRILLGAGVTKYYHGDLMTRAMLLLLALTGNWGKKGTGTSGWCSGLFDGTILAMVKTKPGSEGALELRAGLDIMSEQLRASDPTLTGELPTSTLWRMMGPSTGMSPPAFFWYWHGGYRERWNRPEWNDPSMPRPFDAYWHEAIESNWWGQAARPGPESPPRVLLEIGGNTLRRSRGGLNTVLKHLWPQLTKVVCMDYRMSQTALYADIVLPATQHYEKITFNMPTPWTMFLTMSDAAAPPPGEARSEWEVLADLCRILGERAAARGVQSYTDRNGLTRRYDQLWDAYTLQGALVDDATAAADMLESSVATGNMPPGTTLATFRERGWSRYADWGMSAMTKGQASPFPKGETHVPLRNHVELGHPYPTLTRRAQFLIDHPWFREAGEDLPVHKDPPRMGGNYPFAISSGHNRWGIHAMNNTNPVMLETHRGKPFVLINDQDARAKGIADDALVRIWNDAGEFVVAARVSPCQRPGALTVYNGFEGFMFPGGKGSNEVEPGMIKWLHLVAGYGHLTFTPTEWQPTPVDRCVYVECETYSEQ
jgi:DMSO reductase family type II enzyme molybdopterin subunit